MSPHWSLLCLIAAVAQLPAAPPDGQIQWPSRPPADCPLEKSADLPGIVFTGRHKEYTGADTWYPSWAADGNLYSPWTDGQVGDTPCYSGPRAWSTGHAKITGDDPLNLDVANLGKHKASAEPYGGRYPCGTLVHDSIWYFGTYCLDQKKDPWDIMGPLVGFRISRDYGKTWTDTPRTPLAPLFGESGKNGAKVKMGAPHFVDFGKNMQHSPDGKAYLTGHGATRPEATCSWISGDQVYLARVTPSPENINDPTKYEFFAGLAGGNPDARRKPLWTSDFAKIRPLVEWKDHAGCVTVTYNPPLKRYLMCVTDGGRTGNGPYHTWIAESREITGPWRLVTFLEKFGEQAYFVNIPSKFISADGRTAWLCYSHGWQHKVANPPGSSYSMNLREIKLEESPKRSSSSNFVICPLPALTPCPSPASGRGEAAKVDGTRRVPR